MCIPENGRQNGPYIFATSSILSLAFAVLAAFAVLLILVAVFGVVNRHPALNAVSDNNQDTAWDFAIAHARRLEKEGKPLEGVQFMDRFAPRLQDVPAVNRWRWCIRKAQLWHQASKIARSEADAQIARKARDEMLAAAFQYSRVDNDPAGLENSYAKALESLFHHDDQPKEP